MVRIFLLPVVSVLLGGCMLSPYEGYKYKPYTVKGERYVPLLPDEAPGVLEEGVASHYHEGFLIFPGKTAIGEHIWPWSSTGAHKTLPLPARVRVTNLNNGRSTVIRINDRGPFIPGRNLDVTTAVAKKLGFYEAGLAPVRMEVLSVGDGTWKITKPKFRRTEGALPVEGSAAPDGSGPMWSENVPPAPVRYGE